MDFAKQLRVPPGSKVNLADIDPSGTHGWADKAAADEARQANVDRLAELSSMLWADNRYALLVVLQGMDTAGKDGTIRRVMSGINPRDCRVVSYGKPTEEELEHDFLWRIHRNTPRRGEIGVFNRSHYEDVLVARVRELVPKPVWSARYDHINDFESTLAESGTVILKFFLHISKEEQKERLQARIQDPAKNWKMNPGDLEERQYWDDYQRAYEDAITRCSTDAAPWYIIPADKKWFRNLAVSAILVETLERLRLRYPKPAFDVSKLRVQ
jgi:PPK2 family polyphosphate:nucleotide phosphotransferase